jgi:hypothetical protein
VDKPLNLQFRGEALWDSVTAERDFDAAGYHLLEDACRTADLIARLQDMIDLDEASFINVVEDALGTSDREKRLIVNVRPLLGEIRQQRLAMNALLKQLGVGHLSSEQDEESRESQSFWAAKESEFNKKG